MPLPNIETLLDIGIALSKEQDNDTLFKKILDVAMEITNCDAGTFYVLKDDTLHFRVLINKTFNQRSIGDEITLPPVKLSPHSVSGRAALDKQPINVPNVYDNRDYDFTGTKKYDEMTGYKCVSMLAVPMEDDHLDVIGVIQLINAKNDAGEVVAFAKEYERVIFSLASQAAICLVNHNYAEEITSLLDSFVRVMSAAIDARSPYNANHTRNMARLAELFVDWLHGEGRILFNEQRRRQLYMSVWLHDIGKLVVPLEVMDKSSRLGGRIDTVMNRFRMFEMQNEIDYLRKNKSEHDYQHTLSQIRSAAELVIKADKIGFMPDDMHAEILTLGKKTMPAPGGDEQCLTDSELVSLSVRKGTLTDDERRIMENHVVMTWRMLTEMNFPKNYKSVPDWASGHHEHLNGKGYPNNLAGDDIPLEVRIISILDIFDALTAHDRPYKPALTSEKAFAILDDMAKHGQIDGDILGLFKTSGVWKG